MNLHTLVAPVLATSNGGTVILHSPISNSEHQVECKQYIHRPSTPRNIPKHRLRLKNHF